MQHCHLQVAQHLSYRRQPKGERRRESNRGGERGRERVREGERVIERSMRVKKKALDAAACHILLQQQRLLLMIKHLHTRARTTHTLNTHTHSVSCSICNEMRYEFLLVFSPHLPLPLTTLLASLPLSTPLRCSLAGCYVFLPAFFSLSFFLVSSK